MLQKTALSDLHRDSGARLVDFAGWQLPLHFGSQVEEHHAVRRHAGMFDVSHMSVLDVGGPSAREFLRRLLANDVDRISGGGAAIYSCLLNDAGGVIDDLMVYRLAAERFRVVSNAASRRRVWDWFAVHAGGGGAVLEPRPELAILAVQGPEARDRVHACLDGAVSQRASALLPFGCCEADGLFIARTGYTGEDGYELILPAESAVLLWRALLAAGVRPCGLGARDTLRLEAGLRLAGTDMDETVTPLESGLTWTVAFDPPERDFLGRAALETQRREGGLRRFVGLELEEPGVMRGGYTVRADDDGVGQVTSGIFSPTLARSIAFARLPPGTGTRAQVGIRGQWKEARITGTRFLREVG